MMNDAYNNAKKLGDKAVRKALAEGRFPYLPSLASTVEGLDALSVQYIGLKEIPLDMIRGVRNDGRQDAFAENFMPVLSEASEFAAKWTTLYSSQLEVGILDPIRVCEYMHRFYVVEGNKRVSVMKYVGAPTIMAEINRVLPKAGDDPKVLFYNEFVDFHRVTGLYEIDLSHPGDYRLLADKAGHDLKTPWPEDDVRLLKSACQALKRKGRVTPEQFPDLTIGDALLVYLNFYSLTSLIDEPEAVIRKRVEQIRNELLTEQNADRLTLIEKPEELPETGVIPDLITKTPLPSMLKKTLVADYTEAAPLTAAFIYEAAPETSGWSYGHELGRQAACDHFGNRLKTLAYPECSDEEAFNAAIDDAASKGAEVIFTTSPVLMPLTLKAAVRYPKISFLNCSINLPHNTVRTYDGRSYEAKFLMGALAATCADDHRIGFLAGAPVYGTNAGINAFAIGAAMIDPKAQIFVRWSSAQDLTDPKALAAWNDDMIAQGIRVFSGPSFNPPETYSREYGLYRLRDIATASADEMPDAGAEARPDNNADLARFETSSGVYRIENLAMPIRDWGRYYIRILETVFNGTFTSRSLTKKDQAINYWWGLESGVIDVVLSKKLPYYSRKLVRTLKNAVAAGTLNPFDGELRSRTGLIKDEDSPRLGNEEIITMSWLNDNTVGEPPQASDLSEPALDLVKVSGNAEVRGAAIEAASPAGRDAAAADVSSAGCHSSES